MAFVHELPHLEDAQPCSTGVGTHGALRRYSQGTHGALRGYSRGTHRARMRGTHGVLVRCVWGAEGEMKGDGSRIGRRCSGARQSIPSDLARTKCSGVLTGTLAVLRS
jgi:hypothetical protein